MRSALFLALAIVLALSSAPQRVRAVDHAGRALLDEHGLQSLDMSRDFWPAPGNDAFPRLMVAATLTTVGTPEDFLAGNTSIVDSNTTALEPPKIGDKAYLKTTAFQGQATFQTDLYVISGDFFYSFSTYSDLETSTDQLQQFAIDFFRAGGKSQQLDKTPEFLVDFVAFLPGPELLAGYSLNAEYVNFTVNHGGE